MRVIEPYFKIEGYFNPETIMSTIEAAGRTCYKSEDKICEGSAEKFISGIIKRGHESVLEHEKITVRIICDRAVSHELVRHRIASFSQTSQRYVCYGSDKKGGELTFIQPCFFSEDSENYEWWKVAMQMSENMYLHLIENGAKPEEARAVLPNSTQTEIVVTMNIREWRHFFKLRTSPAAHPSMREIAGMILKEFKEKLPVLFADIELREA